MLLLLLPEGLSRAAAHPVKRQGVFRDDSEFAARRNCHDREGKGKESSSIKKTHQENHCPSVKRHFAPNGERVHERDDVQQHKCRYGGLVEEKLHRAHLQLAVVCADPDGVQGAGENTSEGEDDTQAAGRLHLGVRCWQAVVVADHAHTEASRNQGQEGIPRKGSLIQNKVHEGHAGRQENTGDLVEGDAGERERQVWEDHVEGHGDGEREDGAD